MSGWARGRHNHNTMDKRIKTIEKLSERISSRRFCSSSIGHSFLATSWPTLSPFALSLSSLPLLTLTLEIPPARNDIRCHWLSFGSFPRFSVSLFFYSLIWFFNSIPFHRKCLNRISIVLFEQQNNNKSTEKKRMKMRKDEPTLRIYIETRGQRNLKSISETHRDSGQFNYTLDWIFIHIVCKISKTIKRRSINQCMYMFMSFSVRGLCLSIH